MFRSLLVFVAAFTILATLAAPVALADRQDNWKNLGDLHVRDRVDKDTLRVGPRKGSFDAIRVQVEGRAVQFHDLEIHFENGAVQDVRLRSVIRPGRFSRVIDLDGGQRAIDKIVFIYDAQSRRPGKGSRVEVFGRR